VEIAAVKLMPDGTVRVNEAVEANQFGFKQPCQQQQQQE
jgi:hypothetical protein